MGGDDEIALQAAYNQALTEVLCRTHAAFEKNPDLAKEAEAEKWLCVLEDVFAPVLNCPKLNANGNRIWFSAWTRKMDAAGRGFLPLPKSTRDDDEDKARKVIAAYEDTSWDKYTLSLSQVARQCKTKDRSFVFWSGEPSELGGIDPLAVLDSQVTRTMFVGVDATNIDSWIEKNVPNVPQEREELFRNNNIQPSHVIELQKQRLDKQNENWEDIRTELKKQLLSGWKASGVSAIANSLTDEILNKLINYYCWVRLAYGGTSYWRVMLYLPGVMAKHYDSIPYGINIGLKTMPSLATLMFLKRAILAFFTRLSVDYYEEDALRKAARAKENELARQRYERTKPLFEEISAQLSKFEAMRESIENLRMRLDPTYLSAGQVPYQKMVKLLKPLFENSGSHEIGDHSDANALKDILAKPDLYAEWKKFEVALTEAGFTPKQTEDLFSVWKANQIDKTAEFEKTDGWLPSVALAKWISKSYVPVAWLKVCVEKDVKSKDWLAALSLGDGDDMRVHPTCLCNVLRVLHRTDNVKTEVTTDNNSILVTINVTADFQKPGGLITLKNNVKGKSVENTGTQKQYGQTTRCLLRLQDAVGSPLEFDPPEDQKISDKLKITAKFSDSYNKAMRSNRR